MPEAKRTKPVIAEEALNLIGNTPLVRLRRVVGPHSAKVYAKIEAMNPGGSVKDRICLGMIRDAEEKGLLHKDSVVIEATSGNTGIGLALICAMRGYRLILAMRFECFPNEAGDHDAVLKFIDGNGRVRSERQVTFTLPSGHKFHQVLARFADLAFENPDSYRFDVYVDKVFKVSWPLEVAQSGPVRASGE